MGVFDAGLRLVIPEWEDETNASRGLNDAQLRLLALEGVVRLIQDIAEGASGVVLLVDDLHVADPDSIEAIRYLATAAPSHVLLVGALRSGEAGIAEPVMRALQRDDIVSVLDLDPLDRREVSELLSALLDAEAPSALVDDVVTRTDGVPLLVEEVLEAHLRSGSVDVRAGGVEWRGGTNTVTPTVRDMVEARLERLSSDERAVARAGAVLGDFDTDILAAIFDQPKSAVGNAIVAGVNAGLLESVGGAVDFRHAVIREAMLDSTLPHDLATLHRRAATALAANAVNDATILERRAEHLVQTGESDDAAGLLTSAAVERLRDHASLGAETLARRALDLAEDPATRETASDVLADALAVQGRWTDALALDDATEREFGEKVERLQRMAVCALDAARPERAHELVERALNAGDASPHVRIIAGRVAMAAGRADEALGSADRALAGAQHSGDVATQCAALDVRARALDYAGRRDEARLAWSEQAEIAAAAGLTEAQMRAVVQLGKLEVFTGTPPDRLYEAVDLARAAGALVEQAWAEENLAIALMIQGDPDAGIAILDPAIERCRELRLDQLPYLIAARGGGEAFRNPSAAIELLDEAERLAPTADLAIHTYGIRADMAMRAGRYGEGLEWCQRCVDLIRALPGGMPSDSSCWLVWAHAAVGRFDDALRALREAREFPDDLARWHGRPVLLAAAEALLSRDEAGIDTAIASASGRMPFELALMRVLAAEIIAGPARARWLREALDIYESTGLESDGARVRKLLRDAGGPVPRRRRNRNVPTELAERGVTARETEVLRLLGDGLSNAAVGERLFLSVRTVETHVSSLLAKLHVESRGQLTALSAGVDYDDVQSAPARPRHRT